MSDIISPINWVLRNIGEVIAGLITGMLDFFNDLINNLFVYVADINLENPIISNASVYTTLLGIALISFMGVKHYFTTYVMETSGDPDSDPLDILVRCSEGVAVCCSNDFLFTYFLSFSKAFVNDFAGSPGMIDGTAKIKIWVADLIDRMTPALIIFEIIIFFMVIGIIIFCIIAGIRGAELSLMKLMLPIMAVDLVTTNRERWNNFITSYIMTCLYYGVQLLCFRMFLSSLGQVTVTTLSKELIITFGWFVVMLRSPKWMEKFVYSTGVGRAVGGAGRSAQFLIPSLIRLGR